MTIGIVGYGAYIPRYRITVDEIARVWGKSSIDVKNGLGVEEKAVADSDEDSITMSVEAAKNALARAQIDSKGIRAVFVGSESHPYAVKPSGTVVAQAIGVSKDCYLADYEFACKAGTAAVQTCFAFCKAGEIEYGLGIGADTAQGRPGDALEYTAASGAAAFIVGKYPVAEIEGIYSYATDTTDFWRRQGEEYPSHGGRFTGEPAYFAHVNAGIKGIMAKLSLNFSDVDFIVLHQPNAKFPQRVFKQLNIPKEKWINGLLVPKIGNTYSGASLLGLCAVLDVAKPDQRILVVSYGSGAGSDAICLKTTEKLLQVQNLAPTVDYYLKRKQYIDYALYAKIRGKIKR